jgi:hypothetical protein
MRTKRAPSPRSRRIAAIIRLEADLDTSYVRCVPETWDWRAAARRAEQPRLWTDA